MLYVCFSVFCTLALQHWTPRLLFLTHIFDSSFCFSSFFGMQMQKFLEEKIHQKNWDKSLKKLMVIFFFMAKFLNFRLLQFFYVRIFSRIFFLYFKNSLSMQIHFLREKNSGQEKIQRFFWDGKWAIKFFLEQVCNIFMGEKLLLC